MARSDTYTKLPLATWARFLGVNPFHFSGAYIDEATPPCRSPIMQHSWQTADGISRDEIADAIAEAEANIEDVLGYRVLPTWEQEEWQPTFRPYDMAMWNISSTDIRGKTQFVKTDWGHVVTGGIEAQSLVAAGAPITWTDADGDGVEETGTVGPISTPLMDTCEIVACYPGKDGDKVWEIRPLTRVVIANGQLTITFRRELAVIESKLEAILEPRGVLFTDDANFLDEVDVYRRFNDPQTQVTLMWEGGNCQCGQNCAMCQFTVQTGCLIARGDPKAGQMAFTPGVWNEDTQLFDHVSPSVSRTPDVVRLFYYAGYRNKSLGCDTRDMDPQLARIVAYYAASLLDRPLCGCTTNSIERWGVDRALVGGTNEDMSQKGLYNISPADLDNPLGTTEGAIYAWKRLMSSDRPLARYVLP